PSVVLDQHIKERVFVRGSRRRRHRHSRADRYKTCRYSRTRETETIRDRGERRTDGEDSCGTMRNIILFTVVCLISLAVLGVQGASVSHHSGKHNEHPKSRSYQLTLDNPEQDMSSSIRPINNDSISPWEYVLIRDSDYIPEAISTARCLLTGCRNVSGKEVLDVESKPIWRQILVLKKVRSSDEKNYQLKLAYKKISVGCTCVRPYVQQA
ncbi:hypothetical protein NFI96_013573, partial [Prochilodus magdalenae]